MPFRDIRDFLKRLESEGEIVRIKRRVELDYEISAVIRRALNLGGLDNNKALLFENPGGYSIPVVTNLSATRRRYALALGLEVGQSTAISSKPWRDPFHPSWSIHNPCLPHNPGPGDG